MIRRLFPTLAATVLAVAALATPASAAQPSTSGPTTLATPTGCTTSVEWVQEGSNYYYGRGKVQCTTGRYKAKLVCRNQQTGVGYVRYGSQVVSAPNTAVALCDTGNTVESVHAVPDPLPTGLSGCVGWSEWVVEGSNYYYGRGRAQCDTGRYAVQLSCRNVQTGQLYTLTGYAVNAPSTATLTCYTGNRVESVQAVPR